MGHSRLPDRRQAREFLVYVAAAALYVLIGVLVQAFLLNVVVAMGYLLIVVWLVPAVIRRARRP